MSHGTEPQRRTGDTPEDLEGDIDVLLGGDIPDDVREVAVALRTDIKGLCQGSSDTPVDFRVAEAFRTLIIRIAEMAPGYLQDDILQRQLERSLINEEV